MSLTVNPLPSRLAAKSRAAAPRTPTTRLRESLTPKSVTSSLHLLSQLSPSSPHLPPYGHLYTSVLSVPFSRNVISGSGSGSGSSPSSPSSPTSEGQSSPTRVGERLSVFFGNLGQKTKALLSRKKGRTVQSRALTRRRTRTTKPISRTSSASSDVCIDYVEQVQGPWREFKRLWLSRSNGDGFSVNDDDDVESAETRRSVYEIVPPCFFDPVFDIRKQETFVEIEKLIPGFASAAPDDDGGIGGDPMEVGRRRMRKRFGVATGRPAASKKRRRRRRRRGVVDVCTSVLLKQKLHLFLDLIDEQISKQVMSNSDRYVDVFSHTAQLKAELQEFLDGCNRMEVQFEKFVEDQIQVPLRMIELKTQEQNLRRVEGALVRMQKIVEMENHVLEEIEDAVLSGSGESMLRRLDWLNEAEVLIREDDELSKCTVFREKLARFDHLRGEMKLQAIAYVLDSFMKQFSKAENAPVGPVASVEARDQENDERWYRCLQRFPGAWDEVVVQFKNVLIQLIRGAGDGKWRNVREEEQALQAARDGTVTTSAAASSSSSGATTYLSYAELMPRIQMASACLLRMIQISSDIKSLFERYRQHHSQDLETLFLGMCRLFYSEFAKFLTPVKGYRAYPFRLNPEMAMIIRSIEGFQAAASGAFPSYEDHVLRPTIRDVMKSFLDAYRRRKERFIVDELKREVWAMVTAESNVLLQKVERRVAQLTGIDPTGRVSQPGTIRIHDGKYVVTKSCVSAIGVLCDVLLLYSDARVDKVSLTGKLMNMFRVYCRLSRELILDAAAVRRKTLKSISARHLMVASECVHALARLVPFVVKHLKTKLPRAQLGILDGFDDVAKVLTDLRFHLYDKLFGLMQGIVTGKSREWASKTDWRQSPSKEIQGLMRVLNFVYEKVYLTYLASHPEIMRTQLLRIFRVSCASLAASIRDLMTQPNADGARAAFSDAVFLKKTLSSFLADFQKKFGVAMTLREIGFLEVESVFREKFPPPPEDEDESSGGGGESS